MKRGYSLEEMEHSVADVLIICSTYNQEKYIGDALRGFISQKTDFPFQVLVHDDASTDATPQIIRDFESKYPEIIKGVYEEQTSTAWVIFTGTTNILRGAPLDISLYAKVMTIGWTHVSSRSNLMPCQNAVSVIFA